MSDAEPSLRERKKAKLRAQIILTSLYLFQQRGYQGTRVADIAESLEISQPTFFRYFPSKDAVLRAVFEAKAAHFRQTAVSAIRAAHQPLQQVMMYGAGRIADWVQAHRELTSAFLDSGSLVEWVTHAEGGESSLIRGGLEDIISHWQQAGLIRKECQAGELADLILGTALHIVKVWLISEPGAVDLKGRLTNAAQSLVHGIAARE